MSVQLVHVASGRTFVFEDRAIIGRDSSQCDFVIDDINVSKRHVELVERLDELALRDLQSAGGVLVDGEYIQTGTLRNGDTFCLVSDAHTLIVQIGEDSFLPVGPLPPTRRPATRQDLHVNVTSERGGDRYTVRVHAAGCESPPRTSADNHLLYILARQVLLDTSASVRAPDIGWVETPELANQLDKPHVYLIKYRLVQWLQGLGVPEEAWLEVRRGDRRDGVDGAYRLALSADQLAVDDGTRATKR